MHLQSSVAKLLIWQQLLSCFNQWINLLLLWRFRALGLHPNGLEKHWSFELWCGLDYSIQLLFCSQIPEHLYRGSLFLIILIVNSITKLRILVTLDNTEYVLRIRTSVLVNCSVLSFIFFKHWCSIVFLIETS